LGQVGLKVGLIHGGKTQSMRESALAGFRAGRQRILVATDVAARGLDIQGITHIVNYDVPDTSTSYIHRVGRTARVEEAGEAIRHDEGERNDVSREQAPEPQRSGPQGEHRGYRPRQGKHRADWRMQGSRRGRY